MFSKMLSNQCMRKIPCLHRSGLSLTAALVWFLSAEASNASVEALRTAEALTKPLMFIVKHHYELVFILALVIWLIKSGLVRIGIRRAELVEPIILAASVGPSIAWSFLDPTQDWKYRLGGFVEAAAKGGGSAFGPLGFMADLLFLHAVYTPFYTLLFVLFGIQTFELIRARIVLSLRVKYAITIAAFLCAEFWFAVTQSL